MNYSSKTTKTKTTKTTATTVTQTETQTKERNWSFSIQPVLDWFKVILGEIFGF
jgi:hypothetical protein